MSFSNQNSYLSGMYLKTKSTQKLQQQPKPVQFKNLKKKLENLLEHWTTIVFTTLLTIWALFADDIRQLSSKQEADNIFNILIMICFCLFVLEILVSSFAIKNYFLGFYFWLDVISTLTLLLDVTWISGYIFGTGSSTNIALSGATIARAARASKIGSRAGRIVRILRLIRLIRIVKLYKTSEQIQLKETKKKLKKKELPKLSKKVTKKESIIKTNLSLNNIKENYSMEQENRFRRLTTLHRQKMSLLEILDINLKKQPEYKQASEIENLIENTRVQSFQSNRSQKSKDQIEKDMLEKETNVGKKLSDMTTKRVVIIVLLIMISIPIFSADTYFDKYSNYLYGLEEMHTMMTYENQITSNFDHLWEYYISLNNNEQPKLLSLNLNRKINSGVETVKAYGDLNKVKEFRQTDIKIVVYPESVEEGEFVLLAYFDNKKENDTSSILSIIRTLFVCVILAGGAMLFSKDATDLVLTPIENMLKKISKITKNPLKARQDEEEQAYLYQKLFKQNKNYAKEQEELENYETSVLEKIIVKIGGLLAIGFGQAGSEIIVQNMQKHGGIDPLIPGKKIMAIFGFCDISYFNEMTEILEEDVMVFVNEIAQIVHSQVDKYGGAPNKNIGDVFLLIWKFKESDYENINHNLVIKDHFRIKCLADLSVLAFVKIMAKIKTSYELQKYGVNKKVKERFDDFQVTMGFGLNMGWAIEGAIGSKFKIDASYLSPNVNMASRLMAATKQFKTPLLISDKLYRICSKSLKAQLRRIDVVTVKGSKEPISLYTYDVDLKVLVRKKNEKKKYFGIEKKRQGYIEKQRRVDLMKQIFSGTVGETIELFNNCKNIQMMREKFKQNFFEIWRKGFHFYLEGDWQKAKELLVVTETFFKDEIDGPSQTLLLFMEKYGYQAPESWNGVRKLTQK